MKTFFSQNGEDIFLYKYFLNKPNVDGTFVEFGALDGIIYANSKFFEDELGYRGVLIEPSIQYHNLVRNRPLAQCFNVAISDKIGETVFIGDDGGAGISDTMPTELKIRNHNKQTYVVPCRNLTDILNETSITYIDLLSIDVEGGELSVLRSFDFVIPIYIIIIELHGFNPTNDNLCREILLSKGFSFIIRINANEYWVNTKYFRKDMLYDKNLCIQDSNDINSIGHFPFLYDDQTFRSSLIHALNNFSLTI